jgi:dTDP-4-amino-4,6-dideoxygalactose transaminase
VIRSDRRDDLAEELKSQGIHTGLHYPMPVHLQNCYESWGYKPGDLPVTEQAASEILSLPMFPGLTAEQQARVSASIEAFVSVARR